MRRLLVDLEVCDKCPECVVKCSYIYHPDNIGIAGVRELATFATICHRCEDAPCVSACYKDALERQENGLIKRYNMRCVSCKSCTVACPFGVIFSELLPYLAVSFVGSVSAAILASIGLEAIGLGPQNEPTVGMTIYWSIQFNSLLRGMWWWWGFPIFFTVFLFVSLFLISAGLDQVANPRLRRVA